MFKRFYFFTRLNNIIYIHRINIKMSCYRYILTGKLWVVMGAGWISELLSTLANSEPQWLWTVIDLMNELQGVFIFLILIFKPKLYYLIRKRLGKICILCQNEYINKYNEKSRVCCNINLKCVTKYIEWLQMKYLRIHTINCQPR